MKIIQALFSTTLKNNARLSGRTFYSTSSLQIGAISLKSITNSKLSYASTVSEFGLMTKTICDLIKENSKSNVICYSFPHQGIQVSYKDVNDRVNIMAQNLLDMGFTKGDRIGFILPNTSELAISYLAASQIGLITTMLNPAYQLIELEYMLQKSGVKGVVIYDSFKTLNHLNVIKQICPELETSAPGQLNSKKCPNLKHIILLNSPFEAEKKTYKGTWNFSKISEAKSAAYGNEMPYMELDDPNLILFTSGTTGKPKGALMTQGSLLNSSYLSLVCGGHDLSKKTIVCNPIPFFHIYGFSTGILLPLISETTNVFPFYFPETTTTIGAIEKYKCNFLRATPTQFIDLLNHPNFGKHDMSSLRNGIIAGSTVPPDLLVLMKTVLNLEDIYVGYGMTETSLCHSLTAKTDKLKGDKYAYESCGRGLPFTESKIIDPDTGKIQPIDTDGELHIRGCHIMKEYWEDPEKTSETIDRNGWLNTGDIFSMDSEGYLYFKSRSKDIIIRGGANIYPAEIDAYLRTHPDIIGAESFGVPDKRVGEEICAWIILRPQSQMTEQQLRDYCKGKISHFKIPKFIKFVDRFPINANQKVMKNVMRDEAKKEYDLN